MYRELAAGRHDRPGSSCSAAGRRLAGAETPRLRSRVNLGVRQRQGRRWRRRGREAAEGLHSEDRVRTRDRRPSTRILGRAGRRVAGERARHRPSRGGSYRRCRTTTRRTPVAAMLTTTSGTVHAPPPHHRAAARGRLGTHATTTRASEQGSGMRTTSRSARRRRVTALSGLRTNVAAPAHRRDCAQLSAFRTGRPGHSGDQYAGVQHAGRVELGLHRAQHPDPDRPDLGLQPRPVVGADGVVVGDGRARGDDRVARRRLGDPPLRERVVAPAGRRR